MKLLFLFIAILFAPVTLVAQNSLPTETLEAEVGGSFIMGLNSSSVPYNMGGGLRFFGELRINDNRAPLDIGLQYTVGFLWRTKNDLPTSYSYNIMTTMADYEFSRGKHFSSFVGIGVGLAFVDRDQKGADTNLGRSLCINPRVGFEINTHYRVTFDVKVMTAEYTFLSLGFGYVFGGHATEYTRRP